MTSPWVLRPSTPNSRHGLADLTRRSRKSGTPRARRRTGLIAATATVGVLIVGGAALAAETGFDPTTDIFRALHPAHEQTATTVEPHTLVAEVRDGDARVRLYATTADVSDSCLSLERFAASGQSEGATGFCRSTGAPDLQVLNGVAVGYLPQPNAASAELVTADGTTTSVVVSHRYFLLAPSTVDAGEIVQLTTFDATHHHLSKAPITVRK